MCLVENVAYNLHIRAKYICKCCEPYVSPINVSQSCLYNGIKTETYLKKI